MIRSIAASSLTPPPPLTLPSPPLLANLPPVSGDRNLAVFLRSSDHIRDIHLELRDPGNLFSQQDDVLVPDPLALTIVDLRPNPPNLGGDRERLHSLPELRHVLPHDDPINKPLLHFRPVAASDPVPELLVPLGVGRLDHSVPVHCEIKLQHSVCAHRLVVRVLEVFESADPLRGNEEPGVVVLRRVKVLVPARRPLLRLA